LAPAIAAKKSSENGGKRHFVGGSAMNNQDWVDIFVNHPGDEYSERFNRYSHVYLLR
jgi:hypothetical protein